MGLFSRSPAVVVEAAPTVAAPRQVIRVTATAAKPIDNVVAARIELGYTNFYSYRWAGHADSAAASTTEALSLMGEVGTNYGGNRETSDWVTVTANEVPSTDGRFESAVTEFRLPSWAPGSSKELVRWSCRLVIERNGRDVTERADFALVVGPGDTAFEDSPIERITGDASLIDIALDEPVQRAGGLVRGRVMITPGIAVPTGDIAVYLQRVRTSHPLERIPAPDIEYDGPRVQLEKKADLQAHRTIALPFEIAVPADAAPTASAVHSSLDWYVGTRILYAGFSGPMPERLRRKVVVVNSV